MKTWQNDEDVVVGEDTMELLRLKGDLYSITKRCAIRLRVFWHAWNGKKKRVEQLETLLAVNAKKKKTVACFCVV